MQFSHLFLDKGLHTGDKTEVKYEVTTFPGGELNFRLTSGCPPKILIHQRVKNSEDLMLILMAVNALREMDCEEIQLHIPYLPYARQDRVCNAGEAFSLKVFAELINNCGFTKVFVFDAHSDVGPALINNCVNLDNHTFVYKVVRDILFNMDFDDTKHLAIVAPDAGAVKKIYKVTEMLTNAFPEVEFSLVTCDKVRNLKTMEIERTQVYAKNVYSNALIIDDICDGGRTMIEVAKVLKEKGCDNVNMCVSHGIFSKGFGVFNDLFHMIYSSRSFQSLEFDEGIKYDFDPDMIKQFDMV